MIQLIATIDGKETFCYNKNDHMWMNMKSNTIDLKSVGIIDKIDVVEAFFMFEMNFAFTPVMITYKEICLN